MLKLQVPAQDQIDAATLDPRPEDINKWLDSLHIADVEKSAVKVLEVLRRYNRAQLQPDLRYKALLALIPLATEYIGALRNKYRGNPFPLKQKDRFKAELVLQYTNELAYGFKIIISDAAGNEKNLKTSEKVLIHSVFFAMNFLAESLLARYLVYMPEPVGLWTEINNIYKLAEDKSFVNTGLSVDIEGFRVQRSVAHVYKKICLLTLANPHHLMEGEARKVYQLLDGWVEHCEILHRSDVKFLTGSFYIDLATDFPPKYAGTLTKHTPEDGRVFRIDAMLKAMDTTSNKVAEGSGANKKQLKSLAERMYRDMLLRLHRVWDGKLERKAERKPQSKRILLSASLSTSHHFLSNEAPFTPETDEIRFYRPEGVKGGLSLLPQEYEPWRAVEMEDRIDSGVVKPRTSLFDIDDADVDAWEKIYATKARTRLIMDASEPDFTAQIWDQRNASEGGMGLVRDEPCGIQVRVGDLVAYQFCDDKNPSWFIATIRWLKDIRDETLELGIMMIADNAVPTSVRAIGGVGTGGEYFRSLLVDKIISGAKTKTLIVPANIYDMGTEMALNLDKKISYIRLTQIVETTNSFSQFLFEEIETPENEKENIAILKGL